mmetsp:Transcript_34537/g.110911  ORF Transcript_34537/g.110911 Transcript_34537/m.110911 type:complete len:268 (-) Transcript_34537:32-835(-)
MSLIDERFAAEQRRHWNKYAREPRSQHREEPLDPRAKMRPEGKPYAETASGIFADVVALLPLDDGEEIKKFKSRLRKFTKTHGPLAVATTRDDEGKPLVWYAVDSNDPIATDLLLDQGAASSAFAKVNGDRSPFEHAYAKRYERVVHVLKGWSHRELSDVVDVDDLRTRKAQHHNHRKRGDFCDCPRTCSLSSWGASALCCDAFPCPSIFLPRRGALTSNGTSPNGWHRRHPADHHEDDIIQPELDDDEEDQDEEEEDDDDDDELQV